MLIVIGEIDLILLLHFLVYVVYQDTLLHILLRLLGVDVQLLNGLGHLLVAVLDELGDGLLLLFLLVLELRQAAVKKFEGNQVIICDV